MIRESVCQGEEDGDGEEVVWRCYGGVFGSIEIGLDSVDFCCVF